MNLRESILLLISILLIVPYFFLLKEPEAEKSSRDTPEATPAPAPEMDTSRLDRLLENSIKLKQDYQKISKQLEQLIKESNENPSQTLDTNPQKGEDLSSSIPQESLDRKLSAIVRSEVRKAFSEKSYVDVSKINTHEGKVLKIIDVYLRNIEENIEERLFQQLKKMGPESATVLLALLNEYSNDSSKQDDYLFVYNSLLFILNHEHREIILRQYEEYGRFIELIQKYNMREALELILAKIVASDNRDPLHPLSFELAYKYDKEKSYPYIKKNIETPGYIIDALVSSHPYPNEDLKDSYLIGYKNTLKLKREDYYLRQLYHLSFLMLSKGMPKGFEVALKVFEVKGGDQSYQSELYSLIQYITDFDGHYSKVSPWITANHSKLTWSKEKRKYLLQNH